MNEELRELYQQVILDHNKSPRNFKIIEAHNHFAEGYNPLCGDKIDVYALIEDGIVKDISFQGSGCAISKASASIMSSLIKGKPVAEAEMLFEKFHDLITGKVDSKNALEELGKLAVFAGVKDFPTRVKCASLAWHTMQSAIKNESSSITIEE